MNLDDFVRYETVKWSESLKKNVHRGRYAQYDEKKIRTCLYRPFTRRLLFFDELLVERRTEWPRRFRLLPRSTTTF